MKGWPRNQWALGQEKEGWRKSWMGSVELLGAMGDTSICELVPLCAAWSGPKMSRSPALVHPRYLLPLSNKSSPCSCRGRQHVKVKWRLRAESNGRGKWLWTRGESSDHCYQQIADSPSEWPLSLPPRPSLHRNCVATVCSYKNGIPLLGAVSSA